MTTAALTLANTVRWAELTPACEEDTECCESPCPDPAAWVATAVPVGPMRGHPTLHVLLCEGHVRDWVLHQAGCGECRGFYALTVEPLDRKTARR